MPKLLNVNNYHYRRGGSDVVYLEHGEMFKRAGWDVSWFAMQHAENLPTTWSCFFPREIEMGNRYSAIQKIGMAADIIWSREAAAKMDNLLDVFSADIAHVHLIHHHLSPSILSVLRRRRVPIVMTAHDLKLLCPAYRMHNGREVCERCKPNKVWNCATNSCIHASRPLSALISLESALHRLIGAYRRTVDRVVCPSRFYQRKYLEWGWPAERLTYIPNDFDVGKDRGLIPPGDYLCYFGRLSFEKGLATVIKACAEAKMPLQIVGDGPDDATMRKLAVDAGADVVFHGRQSGDRLFSIVGGARACVLASEWFENAPKSVLEAFALGKPVVGADIGGISELVEHGSRGWLFPSGDISALAQTLRLIASTPDYLLSTMGYEARAFVQSEFSSEKYLSRVKGLYAELGVVGE